MPPSYDEPTVVLDLTATQVQRVRDSEPPPEPNESDIATVRMPLPQWPAVHRQR